MGKSINYSSTTSGPFWYTNSLFFKTNIHIPCCFDGLLHTFVYWKIHIYSSRLCCFQAIDLQQWFLHLLILLHWQLTREQKGIYITGWKELMSPARLQLIYPYFDIYVCVLIGWNLTTENDTSNLYKCKDLGI